MRATERTVWIGVGILIGSGGLPGGSPGGSNVAFAALPPPPPPTVVVAGASGSTGQNGYAQVEVLNDDLFHVEFSLTGTAPTAPAPAILTTPYISQQEFPGPEHVTLTPTGNSGETIDTSTYRLEVSAGPCVTLRDLATMTALSHICAVPAPAPQSPDGAISGLSIAKLGMTNAYGLGEQFRAPGQPNGDWVGSVRSSPLAVGNTMEAYQGGGVANATFPVLYALGAGNTSYAVYVDAIEAQSWDLTGDPWQLKLTGDSIRFYVIAGSNLASLRHRYMDLTGHPPVPPKKAFGLWLSEFSYKNWGQMTDKLTTLRANRFPIDGFVLDAFWCGNFATSDPKNHIGAMTFDPVNFPDPAQHIADMNRNDGLGLMLHEDPFINNWLSGFSDMEARGGLVRQTEGGAPTVIDNYLGDIGIIDWSNEAAASYWHTSRRLPLMNMGVDFHWTDFAEMDGYSGSDWYSGADPFGHTARENHNLFAFAWAKSIADGYLATSERRPFILSRSGTPGVQRFGTAFWSGDIGSNMNSLAAHTNAQMHLSLSGIDYFGSDVGGYHREAVIGDIGDVYTKWFAHSAAFDVPLRPHTNDWDGKQPTAPDRIGDMASNLANIRLRYELSPYYYSLAHLAYLVGDPVIPPLVYYFQADPNVRQIGDEKMIGPWVLVAAAPQNGPVTRDVYLPAGDWVDYRSGKLYRSTGQSVSFNYQANGIFQLPYLVRRGAIFPILWVDDQTMNVMGRRLDGTTITDLNLRVYPAPVRSEFTVYEDDGETVAYRDGAVATTLVAQQATGQQLSIDVAPTLGQYSGAPDSRRVVARVVLPDSTPVTAQLNGTPLTQYSTRALFEAADSGWFWDSTQNTLIFRTPVTSVHVPKSIRIQTAG